MAVLAPIRLRSPSIAGLPLTITRAPGGTTSHDGDVYHGWDFAATTGSVFGEDVLAVADGRVVFVEESVPDGGPSAASGSGDPSLGSAGSLGNVVTFEHNINGQLFYSGNFQVWQSVVLASFSASFAARQTKGCSI